jgi:ABC-2 type transport system permease protein
MNGLRLFGCYASASLRAQAQYPASAVLLATGQFLVTLVEAVGVWALFDRFGSVQGWAFGTVALFYALVNIQFALADLLGRGFDVLGTELLRSGAFDRLLLRPRSLTLQLMGHDLRLSRLGRLVTGLVMLVLATRLAPVDWSVAHIAIALWALAGGVALFFGILVLQGALAFWTIESLELANVFSYGGVEAAQYPLALYERWFRLVLTFAVPLACVAYFPVLAILDRADPLGTPRWLGALAPAAGFAFLGLSFTVWRAGLRRHASTGT